MLFINLNNNKKVIKINRKRKILLFSKHLKNKSSYNNTIIKMFSIAYSFRDQTTRITKMDYPVWSKYRPITNFLNLDLISWIKIVEQEKTVNKAAFSSSCISIFCSLYYYNYNYYLSIFYLSTRNSDI